MPNKKTTKEVKSKKAPKLSVITVNWNGLEYLKKCIDSLVEHSPADTEIIVVDNASTDGSVEYLKEAQSANVRPVFLQENTGWVGGINEGLKWVKGEYVCFINNDIEVTGDWFDNMAKHFDDPDGKNIGMVGCTTNFTMGLQKAELNERFDGNHHIVKYLIGWLMLTKREVLEKVAKNDEKFAEKYNWKTKPACVNKMAGLNPIFGIGSSDDLDISMRMRESGYDLVIAREVFVHHHGSKSFEKLFGKDIGKKGTKAHKDYADDVNKKLGYLKELWGEEKVNELLKIELPGPKFAGTIGIPHGEFIPHKFHTDLLSLQDIHDIKIAHVYGSLVQKARNDLAKEMDGDFLIFLDSDMTFAPDTITKLRKAAEREDVDIVSAACFRKVPNYEPCFFYKIPDNSPGYYWPMRWPEDRLFEVDAVGSACTLIKRKVFESVNFPWYEYTNFLSEDLNFCRKAKENGFRVWIDPTIRIGHLTMLPVDQNVFRGFNAKSLKEYDEELARTGKCPIIENMKSKTMKNYGLHNDR